MSSQNLEYLLSSPFENDRIKVIYFIVKNKRGEFSGILKKMAASDESLNVRYYARKAFSFLESLTEEAREETIESNASDEQAIRAKAVRDKIFELSESENPEDRMKAVRASIKYKIEGNLEFLMRRLLIEADENVVATIIKSLGATSDKSCTNILIKYLKNDDYRIVANAIEALAMLEDERSFPYVVSLLGAPSQDNRITANIIEYLKKYDVERALALLEEMIKFPSDAMVDSAIFVLAGFKSKKVVPLLEQIKNHKNQSIAKKAENAIKLINSSGASDISIETLAHNISMPAPSPEVLSQSVPEKSESDKKIEHIRNMLSTPADSKVVAELASILKNEKDEFVLAYAITACSKVQGTRNISTLKKFLSHENPRIRANTVEVLGELEGVDLLSLMKPLLKDANNRVRANAIVALKKYPNIDHVALINEMIKSSDKLMVTSAIYSIIQIKGDTIELLRDLVKNTDEEIKERAMSALDFLGNDLNDLNAKKLLNELGIGTKNISKSAEYIFSKTVLDQLDVAYNDNLSDVNLLSRKKKEEGFSAKDLKRWLDINSSAIMNVALIVLVLTAGYFAWDYVSTINVSQTFTQTVSSINPFKTPNEQKITILYTSNLYEIAGPAKKTAAVAKLKQAVEQHRSEAEKTNSALLLFDIGNSAFENTEVAAVNSEDGFNLLNEMNFSAISLGGKDMGFCFNFLEPVSKKFKPPVVCSHVFSIKNGEPPEYLKQKAFITAGGLKFCVLGFTDASITAKLPAAISKNFAFKDPVKMAEKICLPENLKPSDYNILIALSHNETDYTRESLSKAAAFDIIIDAGNSVKKNLPTSLVQAGSTYILPSKIKPANAYYGKFEFKYDRKIKNIKDPVWSLFEL